MTSETEEFFRLCKTPEIAYKTIAVTGSDGKTTTTTLIAEMLKAAGKRVHLGGNIGKNLLATLDDIQTEDFVVAELSSFQLMKMTVSPDIAVIKNVTPTISTGTRAWRNMPRRKQTSLISSARTASLS
jgi:UDP-N-acetylmuramoylalanine--D-glutamate ligase